MSSEIKEALAALSARVKDLERIQDHQMKRIDGVMMGVGQAKREFANRIDQLSNHIDKLAEQVLRLSSSPSGKNSVELRQEASLEVDHLQQSR